MSVRERQLAEGSFMVAAIVAAAILLASFYSVARSTMLRAAESRAHGRVATAASLQIDKAQIAASLTARRALAGSSGLASAD